MRVPFGLSILFAFLCAGSFLVERVACSDPFYASYRGGWVWPVGALANTIVGSDDGTVGPFNIGFQFRFYGVTYTTFRLNMNGYITFSPNAASGSTYVPDVLPTLAGAPEQSIFGYWTDLLPSSTTSVPGEPSLAYQTFPGAGPGFRFLVIRWNTQQISGGTASFQIVLREAGDTVSLMWDTVTGTNGGKYVTAGIQGRTATSGQFTAVPRFASAVPWLHKVVCAPFVQTGSIGLSWSFQPSDSELGLNNNWVSFVDMSATSSFYASCVNSGTANNCWQNQFRYGSTPVNPWCPATGGVGGVGSSVTIDLKQNYYLTYSTITGRASDSSYASTYGVDVSTNGGLSFRTTVNPLGSASYVGPPTASSDSGDWDINDNTFFGEGTHTVGQLVRTVVKGVVGNSGCIRAKYFGVPTGHQRMGFQQRDYYDADFTSYNWLSGVGTSLGFTGGGRDDFTMSVPIGFTFTFYGKDYSSIYVCTNGWASFTSNPTTTAAIELPPTVAADVTNLVPAAIYFFGTDLSGVGSAGTYQYKTLGSAPSRIFCIDFINAPYWNAATSTVSVQLQLYETSNKISMQYQTVVPAGLRPVTAGILCATPDSPYKYMGQSIPRMNKEVPGYWSNTAFTFTPVIRDAIGYGNPSVLPDSFVSSTSAIDTTNFARYSRLGYNTGVNNQCWQLLQLSDVGNVNKYIEIQLGQNNDNFYITHIVTQICGGATDRWAGSFRVQVRRGSVFYSYYDVKNAVGGYTFTGNTDTTPTVTQEIGNGFVVWGNGVRVSIMSVGQSGVVPGMRLAIYGFPLYCNNNPCLHGGTCNEGPPYTCTCLAGYEGADCEVVTDRCFPHPCGPGTCASAFNSYTCTCPNGYLGLQCQTNVNECASNPCNGGGSCTDLVNGYTCACTDGRSGAQCQSNIDECASNPCRRGGTCVDGLPGYTCVCPAGTSGRTCETDVNECASFPCANGGTCTDGPNGFTCACSNLWDGVRCTNAADECASNPCTNGGTCTDGLYSFVCACLPGFSGFRCQTNVDECASNPCRNGGSCVDGNNKFTCMCPSSHSGVLCQTNINECASLPCRNGGTCIDQTGSFSCQCSSTYSGLLCQTNINECASQPCQNGAVCSDNNAFYTCACLDGWTGPTCGTNINECASQPCRNGGVCSDATAAFSCACVNGWTGLLCQTDINECLSFPCLNGATCLNLPNSFACTCAPGWSGPLCQTNINECASLPCANGGTCTDGVNKFTCTCLPGWSGALCSNNINECASSPCQFGAPCVDGTNSFTCQCTPGHNGVFCGTDINECASLPCIHGTCVDGDNGFTCFCAPGFGGGMCQSPLFACLSQPCANGGTCQEGGAQYTCICPAGFTGRVCETNVNECASQPCVNGGTCVDGPNGFGCTCAFGYSGVTCQTNVNECASAPCANGGTCTDQLGSFTCKCGAGYSGLNCQTDVNECASTPCMNGGTCTDLVNAFACTCVGGYSGLRCQTNINECASTPCANGGTCHDQLASFDCACVAGYSGLQCQVNIDECASSPCLFGGTCNDLLNGFNCKCAPGYSGLQCQTDVNECASIPCVNGATCLNAIDSFSCLCPAGYSGSLCQTDINECASSPCSTPGGTCHDQLDGFTCQCDKGFLGQRCETNVNECVSDPCQNGATCHDLANAYQCQCVPGWGDTNCDTDIDDCNVNDENPCDRNGVDKCIDLLNGFICQCNPGYTGTLCDTDINECAVNNGGCTGACDNSIGQYFCTPTIKPGSLAQVGYEPVNPLVLARTTVTQNLTFVLLWGPSRWGKELADFSVPDGKFRFTLGTATNPFLVRCTDLIALPPYEKPYTNLTMQCVLPPGTFGNLTGYLSLGSSGAILYATVNETVSYPKPVFTPLTLHQNTTFAGGRTVSNLPTLPKDNIILSTTDEAIPMQFFGDHFSPADPFFSVTYRSAIAPPPGQPPFVCNVSQSLSTESMITCLTQPKAYGSDLKFTIRAGNYEVESEDTLSYPISPTITRVTGCSPVSLPSELAVKNANSTTWGCPTAGGVPITIYGSNFLVSYQMAITVGAVGNGGSKSAVCTYSPSDVVAGDTDHASVICMLPVGAGVSQEVNVALNGEAQFTSSYQTSEPWLSYALPVVTSMTGCDSSASNALHLARCEPAGGQIITLNGNDFGAAEARVLIGGKLCQSVNHTIPHTQMTCILPAGTTENQPVIVIQAVGSFGVGLAKLSYRQCAKGTHVLAGSYTCEDCTPGFFASRTGTLNCETCREGTYSDAHAEQCVFCAIGRYTASQHAPNCTLCAPGKHNENLRQTFCLSCEEGKYMNATGAATCINCPAGKLAAGLGNLECQACPPGSYTEIDGLAVCALCAAGQYAANSSSTTCDLCPEGTASATGETMGATACVECAVATGGTAYQQARGRATCEYCSPGFYWRVDPTGSSPASCLECPAGSVCAQKSGISSEDGWYVFFDEKLGILQSLPCLPKYCQSCASGVSSTTDANGTTTTIDSTTVLGVSTVVSCCAPHRTTAGGNPLCGACEENYFDWGGVCILCEKANTPYLLLFAISTWAYVIVFHKLAQESSADSRILINYAQFVFLFLATQAGDLTSWLALFNFNIFKSSGATCVAPLTDMQRLASGLFVPLFGFGVLFVNCLIHYAIWKCTHTAGQCTACETCCRAKDSVWAVFTRDRTFADVLRRYRRTAMGFLSSSYPSIAQTVFSFFSCVPYKDDEFLQSYPAVSCQHATDYLALYPFFVFLICLVVAMPLLLGARLYYLKSRNLLVGDTATVYGVFTEYYKDKVYTWEVFVLIRRLVIAAVILAPQFTDDQTERFTYLCLCNVVFLTIHFLWAPFRELRDNQMEALAELVLIVLTLFLASAPQPLTPSYAIGLTAMCFLLGLVFVVRMATARFNTLKSLSRTIMDAIQANCCCQAGTNCCIWCRGAEGRAAANAAAQNAKYEKEIRSLKQAEDDDGGSGVQLTAISPLHGGGAGAGAGAGAPPKLIAPMSGDSNPGELASPTSMLSPSSVAGVPAHTFAAATPATPTGAAGGKGASMDAMMLAVARASEDKTADRRASTTTPPPFVTPAPSENAAAAVPPPFPGAGDAGVASATVVVSVDAMPVPVPMPMSYASPPPAPITDLGSGSAVTAVPLEPITFAPLPTLLPVPDASAAVAAGNSTAADEQPPHPTSS